MAKELYVKRNGVDILTDPITPITDFTVSVSFMGDNKLSCEFYYPTLIDFDFTEYIDYEKEGNFATPEEGIERYYLISPPTWEKNEKSRMVQYKCEFVAKIEVLKHIPMVDSFEAVNDVQQAKMPMLYQTEYTFFSETPIDYFTNIKSSMINSLGWWVTDGGIRQPNGWELYIDIEHDYVYAGSGEQITVSNSTVYEALINLHEIFKIPFFIHNNIIIVGGNKSIVSHNFRYGYNNGLYKIIKSLRDENIITKIRGVGAERNLPYDYMQAEKAAVNNENLPALPMPKLMPKIFRDTLAQAATEGDVSVVKDYYINEDKYNEDFPLMTFEEFDDIFPTIREVEYKGHRIDKIVGVYFNASSVELENSTKIDEDKETVEYPYFWIKIPALGFNLWDCLNEKESMVLEMVSGYCGGCKFEIGGVGTSMKKWSRDAFRGNPATDFFRWAEASLIRSTVYKKYTNMVMVDGYYDVQFSNSLFLEKDAFLHRINIKLTHSLTTFQDQNTGYELTFIVNLFKKSDYKIRDDRTLYDFENKKVVTLYKKKYTYPDEVAVIPKTTLNATTLGHTVSSSDEYVVGFMIYMDNIYSAKKKVKGAKVYNLDASISSGMSLVTLQEGVTEKMMKDTTDESLWLYVKKDLESYNMLMPYLRDIDGNYQRHDNPEEWQTAYDNDNVISPQGVVPQPNDEYILTGISLPQPYVLNAEQKLENRLKKILDGRANHKYDYACSFDEAFLARNPDVAAELQVGSVIKVYDEPNPDKEIDLTKYEEVNINSLTLKYKSGSKTATTN